MATRQERAEAGRVLRRVLALVEQGELDGSSPKDIAVLRRGQCRTAGLGRIAKGEGDGLAVPKLDRLTRSIADFARVLEWFTDARGSLVALDMQLDTGTPGGRLVASIMASLGQWERETIAGRTASAL